MSDDPFAGPYTWRERWALLKARIVINRCQRGHHCRRCCCDEPPSRIIEPPLQSWINTYTDNSNGLEP